MSDEEIDWSERHLWPKTLLQELIKSLNKDIVRLNLASNTIDANCQQYIVGIFEDPECKIQSLNLSDTHLTVESANKIFQSLSGKNIVELYLDEMILREDSIKVLSKVLADLPHLQVLSIRGSELSSFSIEILSKSLKNSKSLHYLSLESNEMYTKGAKFLAETLKSTSIISLEIADNNIWVEGTTHLLRSLYADPDASYSGLEFLDISYNAIDFNELSSFVRNSPNLRGLAASGCKGSLEKIPDFFDAIKESNIETLIFDGVNVKETPVGWPKVNDTVFSSPELFNRFFDLINTSTLTDVRVGFLDLEQIYQIITKVTKEITISIQDFGRTGNIWVIDLPNGVLCSPDCDFIWNAPLPLEGSGQAGNIIKMTNCNGKKIKTLQILMCDSADSTIIQFFQSLMGFEKLDLLKITRPPPTEASSTKTDWLTNRTLDGLKDLLTKTEIKEISLSESEFLPLDFAGFFYKIKDIYNATNNLKRLTIGMGSGDGNYLTSDPSETHKHDGIQQLVEFLGICSLESLCLEGHVSFVDAQEIMNGLHKNHVLRSIEFDTNYIDNYKLNPDPHFPGKSVRAAEDFIRSVIAAANENKTLEVVKYQMITELMVAIDEIRELWNDAIDVLDKNKNSNPK